MKKLRFFSKLSIVIAIGFIAQSSYAQSSTTERRATLRFDDELIEGSTQKPDLFYLFQKKNFNYNRLIKMRENFLPEMRRSTEDIQRIRGGN